MGSRLLGRTRSDNEHGATLVEFAFILPIFVLFVFGIIDFGWAFAQNLDVTHATREAARLAVVNGAAGNESLTQLCTDIRGRLSEVNPTAATISLGLQDTNADGALDAGDNVTASISYPLRSLSGLSSRFLSGNLSATAVMRMEQLPSWTQGSCP
jgi:Flp pilus assembly protein TadG